MQRGVLVRLKHEDRQTLGRFMLYAGIDQICSFASLELPWRDNADDVSCIPVGRYLCTKRFSDRYDWHYRITNEDGSDVIDREMILIHFGNFFRNTKGCVLLGQDFSDINHDGLLDVTRSKLSMRLLNSVADHVFNLDVL